ncbi:hypothetical protein [Streptomyces sp. B21-083]|uniref:hypothetical protein n=1 Tax=Streptomyces sp. B21-083 TaxID=3039410 RepID=UPI002FF1FD2D
METRQFGIDVVVVEPGSIRTEWGAIAAETLKETSSKGAYSTLAEGVAKMLAASSQPDARMISAPSVIGKTIVKIAKARRPHMRYRVGFGAAPPCSCAGCCRTAPSTSSSAVPSTSDPTLVSGEIGPLWARAPTRRRGGVIHGMWSGMCASIRATIKRPSAL